MNERIKLLAEQAGIHFHKGGTLDAGPNGIAKFVLYSDMENFAELIVRECLVIVDEEGSHEGGSIRSMEAIKQHFGVEEQEKVAPKPKCSVCGTTENVRYMGGYQPYLCDSVDCIPF